MLRIEVRFDSSKKVAAKVLDALRTEIEKQVLSSYERGVVRVVKGSSAGVTITGVSDEDQKSIMEAIEEIWNSDSWLPV